MICEGENTWPHDNLLCVLRQGPAQQEVRSLRLLLSHFTQLVLRHRIGVVGVRVVVIHVELRILVEALRRPPSEVDARRLDNDQNCCPSTPNKVAKFDRRKVDRGWVTRGDP